MIIKAIYEVPCYIDIDSIEDAFECNGKYVAFTSDGQYTIKEEDFKSWVASPKK